MTRDQKTYRMAYWLASLIVAGVMLSGYYKILRPADFALSVYRFHLLPDVAVNLTALYLPWIETVCALCLIFVPRYRVAALWIALLLLVLFTGGIAINLMRGSAFGCGCFGSAPDAAPMSGLSIARNLALMALVGLALLSRKRAWARP